MEYGKINLQQKKKEGATLERWVVEVDESSYKAFENIIIPQRASITWKLKEGNYHWYSVEIVEAKYNALIWDM